MSEWNPEKYAESSHHQEAWALDMLQRIAFSGTENILDVGCGDGKITGRLAEMTRGFVVGIDKSAEMVSFARRCHETAGHPLLRFEYGTAEEYKSGRIFDLITSFSALHWSGDHPKILRNFHALLKDKGRLLFQFGGRGNAADISAIALQVVGRAPWKRYFENFEYPWHFFGAAEYSSFLSAAGFKPVDVRLVPRDMAHKRREGLRKWMETTWMPFLERFPASLGASFLDEVTEAFEKHYPADKDGLLHTQMVRLQVIAEKTG